LNARKGDVNEMRSISTMYVSLIFCAFFVGQVIPFGQVIGAPLSLLLLAYFEPHFKVKKSLLILAIIGIINFCIFHFELTQFFMNATQNYFYATLQVECPIIVAFTMTLFSGSIGYIALFVTAEQIIKKTGLWNRFPIT
jgi:hypothetical protein